MVGLWSEPFRRLHRHLLIVERDFDVGEMVEGMLDSSES
jgi:hypothetical protein